MDILLTHAYFLYEDPHEQKIMKPYPPLGLLYLSSHLKSKGFKVGVFDSTFSTREALEDAIRVQRPPMVGIYCNLMTRISALDLIRRCRRSGCQVVVGGPEPATYPEEYLARGADVVVVGEGELTLEELLAHQTDSSTELSDIAGLVYRDDNGHTRRTPARSHIKDLDSLPFPDREAIDTETYLETWRCHHGSGAVSLITSRGCPYTCTWCSHSVFGYSHRSRSPENVADEVELILDRYHPDMLWYSDDVFTINYRWLFDYAKELKRRGLKVPFETISREDRLNEDVIKSLAEMGCFRLWIGSESGSQNVMDSMQRRTNVEKVGEVVQLLQNSGIEAGLFVMLGYEGERLEDIETTVQHLKRVNADLFLSTLAYPIKGTPYYDEVADRILSTKPWAQSSDRDLTVAGRHSQRFYSFANRWMVSEIGFHKQSLNSNPDYVEMARTWLNSKIGRLGMAFTRNQRECHPPPP